MTIARTFVIEWLSREMIPVCDPPYDDADINLFVAMLLADAERRGIGRKELEDEVGNLEDFIHGELDQASGRLK